MVSNFFVNGKDAFEYLVDAISKATKSIDIHMFIWRDDELGQLIARSILNAADRDVQVTISKDLIGGIFEYAEESRRSLLHERLPLKLKIMAALLSIAYPMKGKPKKVDHQTSPLAKAMFCHPNIKIHHQKILNDHSKYIIIDHNILIISGMNFELKEWKYDLLGRPYHDFMMAIEDIQVIELFEQAKKQGGHPNITLFSKELNDTDVTHSELPSQFDLIMNTEVNGEYFFNGRKALINRLKQAKQQVTVVMAYIGDKQIMDTFIELSKKGIQIIMYLPENANLQNDLNHYQMKNLLRLTGDKITIYRCKHMIHGKLLQIDHDYMTFGSMNLNKAAMDTLKETNIGCYLSSFGIDKTLARELEHIKANSTKVEGWKTIKYNPIKMLLEKVCCG